MAANETRGTYGDLGTRGAGPDFEEVFRQNVDAFDGMDLVSQVFQVQDTNKAVLRDVGTVGYSFLEFTDEGDDFPEDADMLTFITQYNIRDFTKKVTVTDNMIQDGTYAPALNKFADYARSSKFTMGKAAFNVLNTAFVTTNPTNTFFVDRYGDGLALASVAHTRRDGGSNQSNASATGITLTELNLETLRLQLVKQLTDNGLPLTDMGQITLVVPDDLEKDAVIFTGSQKRATTANNDLNFYSGRINVLTVRWLNSDSGGSATKWHLIAKAASKLKMYVREQPSFGQDTAVNNRNQTFTVKTRFAPGFSEWKGTVHSLGDGQAYSS